MTGKPSLAILKEGVKVCLVSCCLLVSFQATPRAAASLSSTLQEPTPEITPTLEDFYGILPTVETLLISNGGCELPCWWGFRLGQTSDKDWLGFLRRKNLINVIDNVPQHELGTAGSQWLAFSVGGYRHPISSLFDENGMLVQLTVTLNEPRQWLPASVDTISLPSLLRRLNGKPEIYIFQRSSPVDYEIVLIDSEIGLMAKYSFDLWTTVPANQENYPRIMSVCLGMQYTKSIEINLQAPNVESSLGTNERPDVRSQKQQTYISIEEATLGRINADEFTSFFREHLDECLVIDLTTL